METCEPESYIMMKLKIERLYPIQLHLIIYVYGGSDTHSILIQFQKKEREKKKRSSSGTHKHFRLKFKRQHRQTTTIKTFKGEARRWWRTSGIYIYTTQRVETIKSRLRLLRADVARVIRIRYELLLYLLYRCTYEFQ